MEWRWQVTEYNIHSRVMHEMLPADPETTRKFVELVYSGDFDEAALERDFDRVPNGLHAEDFSAAASAYLMAVAAGDVRHCDKDECLYGCECEDEEEWEE